MVYSARHPHIAELVVSTVLHNKEDLFHEVLKAIRFLNPSYNSDKGAFRRLLNGTTLMATFPDHQMVYAALRGRRGGVWRGPPFVTAKMYL